MLLVKNGTVYLGNGRHEAGWDVLCDGPVIRAVGPNLSCEGAQVIDAAGRDVYPGFVLGLCGLGAVSFSEMWSDGMDLDESCVPLCPEMDIRDAFDLRELKLQRFGRVGITSYGLCPGIHAMLAGQIALVHVDGDHTADVFLAERIALKGNFTSNVKSTYKKARKAPQTRMAMHQMLEDAFRAAQEYMNKSEKDYDAGKEVLCRVLRREIPFLVSVETQAEIESVVAVAKKYNLRLVLTGAYAAEHVAEDILKEGYSVMLGDSNYMQAGQRGHTDHRKLVELSRKGMKLSIFCSGDEAYPPAYEQLLWVAAQMCAAGATGDEILDMMTIRPAEALGVEHLVGSLEPGKQADLIICRSNPALRFDNFVDQTIVAGRVFYTREEA